MPGPRESCDGRTPGADRRAGPTGLVLALWLAGPGVPFRLIDRKAGPGEASRAMAVQARTLEFYRQLGIADDVIAAGFRLDRLHLRNRSREIATVPLGDVGKGISPYPVRPQLPAGRPRTAPDRPPARGRPRGRVGHRTDRLHAARRRRAGHAPQARRRGDVGRRVPVRLRRRAQRGAARRWASASPAGRTTSSSTSPTPRRTARGPTATSPPTSPSGRSAWPSRSGGGACSASSAWCPRRSGAATTSRSTTSAAGVEQVTGTRVDAGQLVLDLPRPPPRRRPLPPGPGLPGRRRRARPQPGRRAGDEHRHRRRGEPRLEARRRAGGRAAAGLLDSYEAERIPFARSLVATTDRIFEAVVGRGLLARMVRTVFAPYHPAVRAAIRGRPPGAVPARLADPHHVPDEPAERRVRGRGPRRRPPAVGRGHRQLRPAGVARLAAACLRSGDREAARVRGARGCRCTNGRGPSAARRAGLVRDAAYLVRPDGHRGLGRARRADVEALRAYLGRFGIVARSS